MLQRQWLIATTLTFAANVACSSESPEEDCHSGQTILETDDEPAPFLQVTVNQVLGWAQVHPTVARWQVLPPEVSTNVPPGDTTVAVAVDRATGKAGVTYTIGFVCHTILMKIPVTLNVSSADGALLASIPTALSLQRADFASSKSFFDVQQLTGSLRLTSVDPLLTIGGFAIDISLSSEATAGELTFEPRWHEGSSIRTGAPIPVVMWPPESSCAKGEVEISLPETDTNWRAPIQRANERPWMATAMAARQERIDVQIALDGSICESASGSATPVSIRLQSSDSPLDMTLTGSFRRFGDTLSFTDARSSTMFSPAEFMDKFGDPGVALDGFDRIGMSAGMSLQAPTSTGVTNETGWLTVTGWQNCATPSCTGGTCNCPQGVPSKLLDLALRQQ